MRPRTSERGSVLFRILMSIALFFALGYAVTRDKSGGKGLIEKPGIAAAEFAQYGASVAGAILRLKISENCKDTDLNFENPILKDPAYPGGSTNAAAPSDGHCNVFGAKTGLTYWDPRGRILPRDPARDFLFFTAQAGVSNLGTPASELTMVYVMAPSDLNGQICDAYNRKQGNLGDTSAGTTNTAEWLPARGSGLAYSLVPDTTRLIGEDPAPSAFTGHITGCLNGNSSHDGTAKILYYVLVAR